MNAIRKLARAIYRKLFGRKRSPYAPSSEVMRELSQKAMNIARYAQYKVKCCDLQAEQHGNSNRIKTPRRKGQINMSKCRRESSWAI